jgi:hypothetical protein
VDIDNCSVVKLLERGDHLGQSSTQVKNAWSFTATAPYVFIARLIDLIIVFLYLNGTRLPTEGVLKPPFVTIQPFVTVPTSQHAVGLLNVRNRTVTVRDRAL